MQHLQWLEPRHLFHCFLDTERPSGVCVATTEGRPGSCLTLKDDLGRQSSCCSFFLPSFEIGMMQQPFGCIFVEMTVKHPAYLFPLVHFKAGRHLSREVVDVQTQSLAVPRVEGIVGNNCLNAKLSERLLCPFVLDDLNEVLSGLVCIGDEEGHVFFRFRSRAKGNTTAGSCMRRTRLGLVHVWVARYRTLSRQAGPCLAFVDH